MNVYAALGHRDFGAIASMGSLEMLLHAIKLAGTTIEEIKDWQHEDTKTSLFIASLSNPKDNYAISWYLLKHGVKLNCVTKEGYNELHVLAPRFTHNPEACELAIELIKRGVDINLPNKKYGNTAFFDFCFEYIKRPYEDRWRVIEACIPQNPDVLHKNRRGISAYSFMKEAGDERINRLIEEVLISMKQSMGMGGSLTTKNLLNGIGKLRWCVREEFQNSVDNGWRFFSDQDTDEYLADTNNWVVCDFGTIVEIEPAVLKIFDLPIGTELMFAVEEGHKLFLNMDNEKIVLAVPLEEKKEEPANSVVSVALTEPESTEVKSRRNWQKWWKK